MREPSGELVGLNFYFNNRTCADGLREVVLHCLDDGASFSGQIMAATFEGARSTKMSSIYDAKVSILTLTEDELVSRLGSESTRVTKVGLWNVIGLAESSPEIVTFNGMSAEAPVDEANPIAIVSEGWRFSTDGFEREAARDARKCYTRFVGICNALRPCYASILNEDSLVCRFDLRQGQGTRCFSNFFVSEEAFGTSLIAKIESMYRDAYTERNPAGLYVSTWMFSPKNIKIDRQLALKRSKAIAEMLSM